MSSPHPFELAASDGKIIRGDRAEGKNRQILFITGFLSKRWGNKSKALAQWCEEKGWGFCCYDVRGFGDSGGTFTDYTLSDWIADARLVLNMLQDGPPITIVGNSFGGWIAWMIAQECSAVEKLILIAPAFDALGVRAREISADRRKRWHDTGWMPWDDDPVHKDWPLSWKWVEESEVYWKSSFDRLRPVKTTILHGLQDTVILPSGSSAFVELLLARDPAFPVELHLIPGDHRLSSPEQVERLRRLVLETP
jgi:pimeloyl-ACP methyl ester carboxylesterase